MEPQNQPQNQEPQKQHPRIFTRFIDVLREDLWELCKLNVVCLLTCLPLFTVGPALAALSHCIGELARGEDGEFPAVKSYFSTFRACFSRALGWGLLGLAGTTVLGVAVWYYGSLTAQSYLFAPLTALSALALLFLWGVLLHLFPMTVEAPGDGIFRRALQHAAVRMGRTLVALVLMIAVLAAQVLYFPVSVPITLFIGLIFPGLIGIFAYLDREDLV